MAIVYSLRPESDYYGLFSKSTPTFTIKYQDGMIIPCINSKHFTEFFGANVGIGLLIDAQEFKSECSINYSRLVVSVKSDSNMQENTIVMDKKYKQLFYTNTYFKCIPVHTKVDSARYVEVMISKSTKEVIKMDKNIIINNISVFLYDLCISSAYNDMTFTINTIYGDIHIKLHNITKTTIISDTTTFHLKSTNNIILEHNYASTLNNTKNNSTNNIIDDIVIEPLPKEIMEIKPLSVDLTKLKVGGLKKQLTEIANVIRPWGIKQEHLDKIGMNEFEKGIMLYGGKGTGKTTIARELSKVMGVSNFVVVNGPEVISKYVGESEENIRRILTNYSNELKIVFFDEFDCIAKERNASNNAGTTVANNIVNQILSIMDGVEKKNNILIIASTNRLDVIDSALLRPGRFGLCLYIGLPDVEGRIDIFNIHLEKNITNKTLKHVKIETLVEKSHNYSGAEIKGICKKAREIALSEAAPDLTNLSAIDTSKLMLEQKHFDKAFEFVKCGFSGNYGNITTLLPSGDGNVNAIVKMMDYCYETMLESRINTFLLSGSSWSKKSSSVRVLCDNMKAHFEMITIITDNLIYELSKIDVTTNKNVLIVLDALENLCGILNMSSYNSKNIEYLNKFVNKVVTGKIIFIATMRTNASELFTLINPTFEWNQKYII